MASQLVVRTCRFALVLALAVLGGGRAAAGDAATGGPALRLLRASYLGTPADDDLQGACAGPDGTLYLAGNAGAPLAVDAGVLSRFGDPVAPARCARGFVLRLSADGTTVLGGAEFAPGVASVTTVQANARGVYVAGYATAGLAGVLAAVPGLIRAYPLPTDAAPLQADNANEAPGVPKRAPELAPLPQPKAAGAPFVVRLSSDLRRIECGTYLEGWQQVWPKSRNLTIRPRFLAWPTEHYWHPTLLGLLAGQDVVVCHDGGYSRAPTDADRALAAAIPDAELAKKQLERLSFYDVCDHLSRLSPDLDARTWHRRIHTPTVDVETARRIKNGWPHAHYGNPRTHQLRVGPDDALWLCGWAASSTSQEPWWSPYLWQLDPVSGAVVRKVIEHDPMSGGGNRMGGVVADTAVTAIALEPDGRLLASLLADGGNTPMQRGTVTGHAAVIKLCHWWGRTYRIDPATGTWSDGVQYTGIADSGIAAPAWGIDLAALPDRGFLLLGRQNGRFPWTADAWQQGDAALNPTGFLRAYAAGRALRFSTALPGVLPFALVPLPADRFLVVGQSVGTLHRAVVQPDKSQELAAEPNPGLAAVRGDGATTAIGGSDGYWMLVEWIAGAPVAAPGDGK